MTSLQAAARRMGRALRETHHLREPQLMGIASYPAQARHPVCRAFSEISLTSLENWITRLRG